MFCDVFGGLARGEASRVFLRKSLGREGLCLSATPFSLMFAPVAPILRFIGLLNAAVWLGAMVLFTAIVGPGMFSPEVKMLVGRSEWMPGAIAQILVERYMVLQQWCAAIALVHLIFDWLYTGKLFAKSSLIILVVCLGIALAGTRLLAPQMKQLHVMKYSPQTTAAQKEHAARSFRILHATSQITNLMALCGVLFYYWRLSVGPQGVRSSAGSRYRG